MTRNTLGLLLVVSLVFNVCFAIGYIRAQQSPAPDDAPTVEVVAPEDATDPDLAIEPLDGDGDRPDDPSPRGADRRGDRGADGPRDGRDGRRGPSRRDMDPVSAGVARLLELDETQLAYFWLQREELEADERVFSVALNAVRQQIVTGFENDASESVIAELQDREADLMQQRIAARNDRLKGFLQVLRPEQVSKFNTLMERSFSPERAIARDVAKLDTDGDGTLDDDEIAQIREQFAERIRERRDRWEAARQQMLEEFDADGDGTLDPEEREASRESMMRRQFDRNGDGTLDADEEAEMNRLREKARRDGRRGGRSGFGGRSRSDRGDRGDRDDGRGGGPAADPPTTPDAADVDAPGTARDATAGRPFGGRAIGRRMPMRPPLQERIRDRADRALPWLRSDDGDAAPRDDDGAAETAPATLPTPLA